MADTVVDDELWEEFHSLVNMSSADLRTWLAVDDAHESAEELPDQAGAPTSQTVLAILGKRRTDLTDEDARTMATVVDAIRAQRGEEPEPTAGSDDWRRRMMALGHDPLKPLR